MKAAGVVGELGDDFAGREEMRPDRWGAANNWKRPGILWLGGGEAADGTGRGPGQARGSEGFGRGHGRGPTGTRGRGFVGLSPGELPPEEKRVLEGWSSLTRN
ncbi:MAG: hypothetical protein GX052_03200 [Syntrophomonadaceae bacterium]|jgi:hypothetical protein|nr:hypothetical protein [Syntrophomonadaceae bacterium]